MRGDGGVGLVALADEEAQPQVPLAVGLVVEREAGRVGAAVLAAVEHADQRLADLASLAVALLVEDPGDAAHRLTTPSSRERTPIIPLAIGSATVAHAGRPGRRRRARRPPGAPVPYACGGAGGAVGVLRRASAVGTDPQRARDLAEARSQLGAVLRRRAPAPAATSDIPW